MAIDFIHLRVYSEYSFGESVVRIDDLLQRCVEMSMPAVALTDENNFFSVIKFYQKALHYGIKPIIGCDISYRLTDGDGRANVVMLARDEEGYHFLIQLLSRMWQRTDTDRAIADKSWLFENCAHLIVLSGGHDGEIGQSIEMHSMDRARSLLREWRQHYPDAFYIEVQRTGRENESNYLHTALNLANDEKCPFVATNAVRMVAAENYPAQQARMCIQHGYKLNAIPAYERNFYQPTQYVRSAEEMAECFADCPESLHNSVAIAQRCNIKIATGCIHMPAYPLNDRQDPNVYLEEKARTGLKKRLVRIRTMRKSVDEDAYWQRLDYELDMIKKMGFVGYFLIVMDFIQWARSNHIAVGPGRGSGAGSLLAYGLEITGLDPLEYGLLFERFLNPERVSMPDFDIDFCAKGRDRVIEYVSERYGRERVSQIITFNRLAAKAVIHDVTRIQNKPPHVGHALSLFIPLEPDITLLSAYQSSTRLQDYLKENPEAKEIWDLALQLEGLVRNAGRHAGGIVISDRSLVNYTPLYTDDKNHLLTQFDMKDLEEVGLIKFDFLSLRTLTIIDETLQNISQDQAQMEKETIMDTMRLDDAKVFDMIGQGNTTAVFQLESGGMRQMLQEMQPNRFDDLIAALALFRPGPMDNIPSYIQRKHDAEEITYIHETMSEVLEETYGIIVYQEQVMQIAQILAGYSLSEADLLRRAMGKKQRAEMERHRFVFQQRAENKGIPRTAAQKAFKEMERFADYGFNKCHASPYAFLSYQTAWLKTHYAAEFLAACMSADSGNADKLDLLYSECTRLDIKVCLPNVNQSMRQFSLLGEAERTIIFGLDAIKNVSHHCIERILRARNQGGVFSDLFDLCRRIDTRSIAHSMMEGLIKSGACDDLIAGKYMLPKKRSILCASLESAMGTAERHLNDKESGMTDLFHNFNDKSNVDTDIYAVYRHNEGDASWLIDEKKLLGIYLTAHPLDDYRADIAGLKTTSIADLLHSTAMQSNVQIVGWVMNAYQTGRKLKDTILLHLWDHSERIKIRLPPNIPQPEKISVDTALLVTLECKREQKNRNLFYADRVKTMDAVRSECLKSITLVLDNGTDEHLLASIQAILGKASAGQCTVRINYTAIPNHGSALNGVYQLSERKEITNELLVRLRRLNGTAVQLNYD